MSLKKLVDTDLLSRFLTKVKALIPAAATAAPKMDGTAAVGSSPKYAKEDHVHPRDTTSYRRPYYERGNTNDIGMRPLVDFARANRLAFLPADQVIIEKTTDGGETWEDAEIVDGHKKNLFATRNGYIPIPLLNGEKSTSCGIRITITGMKYDVPDGTPETEKYNYWNNNYVKSNERYCTLSEMWFWLSSNADAIRAEVYCATGANPNNWITVFDTDFGLTGWSGSDWIRWDYARTFGGGINQTGNYWNWRIVFWSRMLDGDTTFRSTAVQTVAGIYGFGSNVWGMPNGLMQNDHLYKWDTNQNAQFPANVTATQFNGNVNGNATNVTGIVGLPNGGTGSSSAAQGYANLQDRGYISDANLAISRGIYWTNDSTLNLPDHSPSNSKHGILRCYLNGSASVQNGQNNWLWQFLTYTSSDRVFFRRKINADNFTAWVDLSDAMTVNGHTVESDVPANAIFTDTTYESKPASSGGTEVSLVTTGEKATWNAKGTYSKPAGGIPDSDIASAATWNAKGNGTITGITMNGASKGTSGVVDLGTVITEHQDISGKLNSSLKGAAGGLAELDSSGKVPSSQLPSYVDDVVEYTSKSAFPATGESGKIYVDTTANLTYRWSGSAYVEISPSLALGTTASTAFRGDHGNAAYAHAVTNKGSAFTSGLYKITTNAEGHVTGAAAVQKSDITALGIPESDTKYTPANTAPGKVASASSTGTSTNYARQDHTHGIDLATGDSNGQVKIAGQNVSVKGLKALAYADSVTKVNGHTVYSDVPTNAYFKNLLEIGSSTTIPNGSDLNDYTTAGRYHTTINGHNISNLPSTAVGAFSLVVADDILGNSYDCYQFLFGGDASRDTIYVRAYSSTRGWRDWYDICLQPASTDPLMDDSSAAVGTSLKYAREDHVHPRDSKVFSLLETNDIPISSGDNLNNYKTAGNYICSSASLSASIVNAPGYAAFKLVVIKVLGDERYIQIAFMNPGTPTFQNRPILVRTYNGAVWSGWFNIRDAETVNGHTVESDVPANIFESKAASEGGTDLSLITTGEKYKWNLAYSDVGRQDLTFVQGNIVNGNNSTNNKAARIRTNDYYPINDPGYGFDIDIPDGYRIYSYFYDSSKTYLDFVTWMTGYKKYENETDIPANAYYVRFVCSLVENTNLTPSSLPRTIYFRKRLYKE